MKVLIAHPGKQHSQRLAAAVKFSGYEFKYCTTVYNSNKSFLVKIITPFLPNAYAKKLERRQLNELEETDVIRFCEFGGLFLLFLSKVDRSTRIYSRYKSHLADKFGKKVARYAVKNNFDAVIMYDTTAVECFRMLKEKQPSMIRLIDHAQTPRNYLYKVYQELKPSCGEFWSTLKNAKHVNDISYGNEALKEILLADYHIVASSFSKAGLLYSGVDEKHIFVVPYGVDLDKFKPEMKTKRDVIKLLFVGAVNQRKGIYQILEAARRINDSNIEFHIVGDGRQSNEELYRPYEKYVHFHGQLFGKELEKIYSDSDVFLFPVMGEGYGLVVLEALASGLPVISSYNCVGTDIIQDSYNGFLIEAGDTDALIEKIIWLRNNKDKLEDMSKNARVSVENYSWGSYYKTVSQTLKTIETYYTQ